MKRLVCLGDSITDSDRLFSPNGLGFGYVNHLNTLLNQEHISYEIVNRGVDGFTVKRLLQNVIPDCIERQPDVVTILIGINDVGILMNTDRTLSQQEDLLMRFKDCYRQLLSQIRQHSNCKMILMEPFLFPYPREYENWIPWVKRISTLIQELAEDFDLPYVLLYHRLNQAALTEGFDALTTDGIHLTLPGHRLIADTVVSLIDTP